MSSGAAPAAGVAKAKARTQNAIPQMRATGVLRETAPPLATPGLPRSDKLEEEARRMEERLKQLKVAMTTEKQKREAITKTKAGTFWKAANPVTDNKSYMEDVLARVEKRIAKSNALTSQQKAAPAAASGHAGVGTTPAGAGSTMVRPAASSTSTTQRGSASDSRVSSAAADTAVKSSYAPPIQPKNAISAPSPIRPQQSDSSSQANTAATESAPSARGSARSPATAIAQPVSARSTVPAASSLSSKPPSNADGTVSAAPGSLLDGDFDEAENKRAFEEARQQWIAETAVSSTVNGKSDASATIPSKPSRTQLVHDPDYSPAELVPSGPSGGSSLLDGPSFNERESAKEFQEARRAWMQSLAEEQAGGASSRKPKAKAANATAVDSADGMWNPGAALGTGGSILFPSEAESSTAPAVSSALRSAQSSLENTSKHSCYQCYKLFYASNTVNDPDFPGKPFCSRECVEATATGTKLRCAGIGCNKSLLRDQGVRVDGHIMCHGCAGNGGKAIPLASITPPSPEAAPLQAASPELDEEEEEEDEPLRVNEDQAEDEAVEEKDVPVEAAAVADVSRPATSAGQPAAFISGAPLSRPTTAQRAVLDTSVIRVAPAGVSAAPVVEFPSDDDD